MNMTFSSTIDLASGLRDNGRALGLRSWMVALLLTLAPAIASATGGLPTDLNKETEVLDIEALFPSEEGLVKVEVSGIDSHDFLARYMGDSLFIPYQGICDFIRMTNSISPDLMTMTGEIDRKGAFTISRASGTVTYAGGESFSFPMTEIRIVRGEVYIEYTLLSKVLGVTMNFDASNLKLLISSDDRLPIVQWTRNQSRYQSLMFDRADARQDETGEMHRGLFSAPIINWGINSSLDRSLTRNVGAQLRFGSQFLYGVLEGGIIGGYASNAANYSVDGITWRFQTPEFAPLRQVTVGTLLIDGNRRNGVEVSNAPLAPYKNARIYELTGQTQPGWNVELYDGARLIDVTQGDSVGRYGFKIPMNYGTIDRTIRQMGPHGEVIVEDRRIQLGQEMLPAGVVEYTAAAAVDSLSTSANLSGKGRLSVGLGDRITVGGEVRYQSPLASRFSADSLRPTALASLWLGQTTSLGLRYDVLASLLAGDLYTITSDNGSYRLLVDSLSPTALTGHMVGTMSKTFDRISVGGEAQVRRLNDGLTYSIEPQISGNIGGYTFVGGTRYASSTIPSESVMATRFGSGQQLTSSLRVIGSPFAAMLLSAQGTYSFTERTLAGLDVTAYFRLGGTFGLNLGYHVSNLNWSNATVQAQLNIDLASLRATVNSTFVDGNLMGSTQLQGSAILSSHGIQTFADPSVGQASVLIVAYNDANGNGVRDNGEETIDAPPARLSLDGADRSTDDGIFRAVPANRECMVEVDRWFHATNNLFPGRSRFPLYTIPDELQVLEIPFSEGFDVTALCTTVDADGSRERANRGQTDGLRVRLVSTTGQSFDGEVFVDGTMLVTGVTAGEYMIEFDAAQLASRRLSTGDGLPTVKLSSADHHMPAIILQMVESAR